MQPMEVGIVDITEEYVAPIAIVHDVHVEQSFLQHSGSAKGFEDGGAW